MDKLKMTPEQQLAFDGFIDVMVQIYKMTSDKIDYSKVENDKDKQTTRLYISWADENPMIG